MSLSTDGVPNPAPSCHSAPPSCHSERSEESPHTQAESIPPEPPPPTSSSTSTPSFPPPPSSFPRRRESTATHAQPTPPPPPRRKIIVGLGNPGPRYAATRHNIGFDCISLLSKRWNIPLDDRRQHAILGQGEVKNLPVVLAKPRTFMNNSGEAVRYLLARFHAQPSDLVIIYDEMDLPLGTIRLRPRGGTAGHQGMASIVSVVGAKKFPRVRVGIGKPESADDWIRYVLEPFREDELDEVRGVVERVADCFDSLLKEGIDRAMNRFNTLPAPPPEPSSPSHPDHPTHACHSERSEESHPG